MVLLGFAGIIPNKSDIKPVIDINPIDSVEIKKKFGIANIPISIFNNSDFNATITSADIRFKNGTWRSLIIYQNDRKEIIRSRRTCKEKLSSPLEMTTDSKYFSTLQLTPYQKRIIYFDSPTKLSSPSGQDWLKSLEKCCDDSSMTAIIKLEWENDIGREFTKKSAFDISCSCKKEDRHYVFDAIHVD